MGSPQSVAALPLFDFPIDGRGKPNAINLPFVGMVYPLYHSLMVILGMVSCWIYMDLPYYSKTCQSNMAFEPCPCLITKKKPLMF